MININITYQCADGSLWATNVQCPPSMPAMCLAPQFALEQASWEHKQAVKPLIVSRG